MHVLEILTWYSSGLLPCVLFRFLPVLFSHQIPLESFIQIQEREKKSGFPYGIALNSNWRWSLSSDNVISLSIDWNYFNNPIRIFERLWMQWTVSTIKMDSLADVAYFNMDRDYWHTLGIFRKKESVYDRSVCPFFRHLSTIRNTFRYDWWYKW